MSKGNECAFPNHINKTQDSWAEDISIGLTKREYFAAMAMQGMNIPLLYGDGGQWEIGQAQQVAKSATIYADALIKALNASEVEGSSK